jgi:CubicO group peptidase (beta-lactamase class C family)
MTKSALNALVGILVSQGRLTLEQPAPVPEWRDDQRRRITIDHLLRMSSGLDFEERISLPRFDVMSMLFEAPDMASFAAGAQLRAEPGTRWQYASGSSLIVSGIVRRILGDEPYQRFPKQALFDRLGMSRAVIEQDASGTFVASSFMYATAREWGRLGNLFAQDGKYDGSEILPAWWVAYSRTPAPADPARSYGAHFWLTLPDTYNASHAALPVDTFHMAGHEGQFVTIVPSKHTVIVRLGKTRYPGAWDQSKFAADILAAMQ